MQDVANYRPVAELMPKAWQQGTVMAADGTKLAYTLAGKPKNPPMVLLHGIQSMGVTWMRTAQAFEQAYHVLMPDFRGHGHSDDISNGFSGELLVQDTITLLAALEIENPIVIGHSMGADIAGRLAAQIPVKALVLVDPALFNFLSVMPDINLDDPPPWLRSVLKAMQELRTQSLPERLETAKRLMPPGAKIYTEADHVTFIEGMAQFDARVFEHTNQMGYLFEMPETIAQITAPTLLITARPMVQQVDMTPGREAVLNNLQNGQHLHYEDSGHAVMFERFQRFIKDVQTFLATV